MLNKAFNFWNKRLLNLSFIKHIGGFIFCELTDYLYRGYEKNYYILHRMVLHSWSGSDSELDGLNKQSGR